MPRKTYNSGLLPADSVPARREKPPAGDNLADRLEGLGTTRSTPLAQVGCANYLLDQDESELLAEALGVSDAYHKVKAIKAREAAP